MSFVSIRTGACSTAILNFIAREFYLAPIPCRWYEISAIGSSLVNVNRSFRSNSVFPLFDIIELNFNHQCTLRTLMCIPACKFWDKYYIPFKIETFNNALCNVRICNSIIKMIIIIYYSQLYDNKKCSKTFGWKCEEHFLFCYNLYLYIYMYIFNCQHVLIEENISSFLYD